MKVEIINDTKINNANVVAGTVITFSDSVAKNFIDNGIAKPYVEDEIQTEPKQEKQTRKGK